MPSHYLVPVIPGQPQVLPFRQSNTLSWLMGSPQEKGGEHEAAPSFPGYPMFVHSDDIKLRLFVLWTLQSPTYRL